jgi:DNA-binding transcriptional MerR regulator
MKFDELIRRANQRLVELGLDQVQDARVSGQFNERNVRFLRFSGVLTKPDGQGSAARWSDLHVQQLITCRALQATGLSVNEASRQINGLNFEHLQALAVETLASIKEHQIKTRDDGQVEPCSAWQITPDFLLVATHRTGISPEKLAQIRRILTHSTP